MKTYRRPFVIGVGLGVLLAGCAGTAEDMDAQVLIDSTSRELFIDPNTQTGTNGLRPNHFHAAKALLLESMSKKLLVGGKINPAILGSGICDTEAGEQIVKYAVKCALDKSALVECGDLSIKGGGMLGTTLNWPNQPLASAARRELMACVAAHINPYDVPSVPILLSGAPVNGMSQGFGEYNFEEAVWIAKPEPSGALQIHVWPSAEMTAYCGGEAVTSKWFQHRICGHKPETCGLVMRNDFASACVSPTGLTGTYTCDGQPALESWLTESDALDLYGTSCAL